MKRTIVCLALAALAMAAAGANNNTSQLGYYRFPALHNDTLLFTAEGDLWRVNARGGAAERLTTHPSEESRPAISPDGSTVAFSAAYEGPTEVYTMPLDGGVPMRQTWEGGENALVVGWTPTGEVLFATRRYSTLPDTQLGRVDPSTGVRDLCRSRRRATARTPQSGATLFFTRLPFQGSHAKRYKGGTAQNLWRFARGAAEAAAADRPTTRGPASGRCCGTAASTSSATATAR